MREGADLMLYDGECGLCAASVQFILRHERRDTLQFAALDSRVGDDVRARHPQLHGVDSMVWVRRDPRGERVYVRSAAAWRAARYLGGPWMIFAAAFLVPRAARDFVYDQMARHRHRILPEPSQCFVPPAHVRSRFIDRS